MPRIFLDNNSTTPVDPRVLDAMLPYFTEHFGNAASRSHSFGWDANNAVEASRREVAALIGAVSSKEIVFTSGATESNNLALKGVLEAAGGSRKRIIVSAIEHKSVLDAASHLQSIGYLVEKLEVNPQGYVEPERLMAFLSADTALVSVMLANNEVGTVQPIGELSSLVHECGALLHVDAAQGLGLVDFDVERLHVDLASLSAHKMYGPKGCGALYVRSKHPRVRLSPQIEGGGHEQGLRSGTLNVPGIVGFGRACELLRQEGASERTRIAEMRDTLKSRLLSALPQVVINGGMETRLPGNLNVTFPAIDSGTLMRSIGEVALSSGSACSSATPEPSYVLTAMGVTPELARCSIRFGIGRFNEPSEIEAVAERVVDGVRRLLPL
jgi:cysteine desulfurase